MLNKFAQRLSELLETNGLSKRAFAKQIEVSSMSVSDWTTGKVQPVAENIFLVAKYFKVSADYLLGLEDEFGVKIY